MGAVPPRVASHACLEVSLGQPVGSRSNAIVAVLAAAFVASSLVGLAAPSGAQTFVVTDHEDLDFDRPEAWAMAWFAAVAFPTALGTETLPPGAVELSLEGGWVPSLSEEQRTVGFLGEKPEDLNRASIFGRPRVAVGLPGRLTATLSWAPPADVDGVEPDVLSLSLARPLWEGERGRVAARVFGQRGELRGDLTCPRDISGIADCRVNPYGCEQPSRDEMSLRVVGAELQAGTTLASAPAVSPYVAIAMSRLDAEFQVDARRNGFLDRTLLETDGTFWSGTLGVSVDAGRRARLSGELFYTPLDVVGRAGKGKETDGLLNGRVLLGYRVR
jgi:hypothetical protein